MRGPAMAGIVLAAFVFDPTVAVGQSSEMFGLSEIAVPGTVIETAAAEDAAWIRTTDGQLYLVYRASGEFVLEPVITTGSRTDPPADLLPDSREVLGPDRIRSVRLTEPTGRYPHGVLGDGLEAASLTLRIKKSSAFVVEAGDNAVFEDLVPRLADLDGDGRDEIIVVKSYLDRGAALAVIGFDRDGSLAILAETPPIGRPNRWLNPIGAADFDGDGRVEIAYVETPHIGGTLMIWEWRDGRLVRELAEPGFSNHAIGSTELGLSAIVDIDGDGVMDLAVPGRRRDRMRLISFAGGAFRELAEVEIDGVVATAVAPVGRSLVFGLADGRLVALRFGP